APASTHTSETHPRSTPRSLPEPNATHALPQQHARSTELWPVIIARGTHPFPSRTRSLSLAARMVLPERSGGRVRRYRPLISSNDARGPFRGRERFSFTGGNGGNGRDRGRARPRAPSRSR